MTESRLEPSAIAAFEQAGDLASLAARMEERYEKEEQEPVQESGIPAEEDEQEPVETPEDSEDGPEDDGSDEELTEVELLSYFGIENGKIQFEDGEVDFNSLSPEEKLDVYKQLLYTRIPEDEDDSQTESNLPDLDDAEVELLNMARQAGGVDKLMQQLASQSDVDNKPFADYTDEEMFRYDYLDSLPEEVLEEMSDEDRENLLQTAYDKAKEDKVFSQRMKMLRTKHAEQEEAEEAIRHQQEMAEQEARLEEQRREFVQATAPLETMGAFELNDDIKEFVYSKMLEVDEEGMSPFMRDVFSNPLNAFKAAYYFYLGQAQEDKLIEWTKAEISKARNEGKKEAVQGWPKQPMVQKREENNPPKQEKQSSSNTYDPNARMMEALMNAPSDRELYSKKR